MNDVERVDEYRRLASEAYVARPLPSNLPGARGDGWTSASGGPGGVPVPVPVPGAREPPPAWPQNGRLVFDHLRLCYPSNPSTAVLKDLSFTVEGRQRVGIVGRTGAGKSSLAVALFRLVEPASGKATCLLTCQAPSLT
jgi:ABC-type multidrug transport system fused ATPase/permease subunit